MATAPLSQIKRKEIAQDIILGELSLHKIARKHNVSVGVVHKLKTQIPDDVVNTVNAGIDYRRGLQEMEMNNVHENGNSVNKTVNSVNAIVTPEMVSEIVAKKAKNLEFFTSASVYLGKVAVDRVKADKDGIPLHEVHTAQRILKDGRETAYPARQETTINQTTNTQINVSEIELLPFS